MIRYEIVSKTRVFSHGYHHKIYKGCTIEEIGGPCQVVASFPSLTIAQREFKKIRTSIEKKQTLVKKKPKPIYNLCYMVTEYFLQKSFYEPSYSGYTCLKLYGISPTEITLLDITDDRRIGAFDNLFSAERYLTNLMIDNNSKGIDKRYSLILPRYNYVPPDEYKPPTDYM